MLSHAHAVESVNRVNGLIDFLRRWDDKGELKYKELRFSVADGGNINLQGNSGCNESFLLTRWHPSFANSLEAGVRELVVRLVTAWDCVTYSSCEGHRSSAQVPARVRHVRLVSRSKAEHVRLGSMLKRLVDATNADIGDPGVRLAWKASVIVAEEGLEAPGLDLIFEPQSDDERVYWKYLDTSYQRCLLQLSKESSQ
ncbi:hypothetical protein [Mesorhizobium sp. M0408]|uniref:hypothetical protein n=1 Tax=Mesorhizobium sp. M0408 TaxID=2956942 RepID=UPI003335BA6D